MQKKILISLIGIVAVFGAYAFLSKGIATEPAADKKVSVVTTLFPLYDFARTVGGSYAEVTLLLPPGVEAHAFEPTPGDIAKIERADIFTYTGPLMEPWAVDIAASASERGVRVVNASEGIDFIESVFHDADEPVGARDPHVWLDFDNTAKMVASLAAALAEKDPAHAAEYQANADAYRAKLAALDGLYRETLSSCQTKTIIYGGHYAFGYLAHRYGLEYVAVQGIAPDAEPSAKDLVAMVEQIRRDHIGAVFYEELSSPKIAETIAGETGASLLLLNAAHNITKEDYTGGTTFLSIMEENLANLSSGLKCQSR